MKVLLISQNITQKFVASLFSTLSKLCISFKSGNNLSTTLNLKLFASCQMPEITLSIFLSILQITGLILQFMSFLICWLLFNHTLNQSIFVHKTLFTMIVNFVFGRWNPTLFLLFEVIYQLFLSINFSSEIRRWKMLCISIFLLSIIEQYFLRRFFRIDFICEWKLCG